MIRNFTTLSPFDGGMFVLLQRKISLNISVTFEQFQLNFWLKLSDLDSHVMLIIHKNFVNIKMSLIILAPTQLCCNFT